jgi:hypothetical protein
MRRFIVLGLQESYAAIKPGLNRPLPELGEQLEMVDCTCEGRQQTVTVTRVEVERNVFDAVIEECK